MAIILLAPSYQWILYNRRRSERLRLLRIAVNSSGREELHVGDSSKMTRSMQSGVPSTSTVGVSAECPICFGVFVKTIAIYPWERRKELSR